MRQQILILVSNLFLGTYFKEITQSKNDRFLKDITCSFVKKKIKIRKEKPFKSTRYF